jgi:hypothetical protein
VKDVLDMAETSGDFETAAKRLRELMAEAPQTDTVRAVNRATMFSRLLGMFRAQR